MSTIITEEKNENNQVTHRVYDDNVEEWHEYDANGNRVHYRNTYGYQSWYDYNENKGLIHFKNSSNFETWFDGAGNQISNPNG